ncbi:MAG: dimethylargininase [Acidobacteria bacterium]|nr:dimethylargininase [Acidobacteriota bacterium]
MLFALTREISPRFAECQLTHLPRVAIDIERARAQHDAYEWALVELGCTIRRIDSAPETPDAVFIEDTAVVLREGAVIARPGAEPRRAEVPAVAAALARFGLPQHELAAPATLDGGDVLVVGRQVFIGASARTNVEGIDQMRRLLEPFGYRVRAVPVHSCLHLKSAVTAVGRDTILINRDWVPADAFAGPTLVDVDPDEPHAANALWVAGPGGLDLRGDGVVIYPAAYPKTGRRLEAHGIRVRAVEVDELAKAEGGVTCCSLLVKFGRS